MSKNEASELETVRMHNAPLVLPPLYFDPSGFAVNNTFLPQLNSNSIQSSSSNRNIKKNQKAQQSRNASLNPYNHKTYSVHEFVTLEFSNPISINPAKLMSRERKLIPIVNPETKQVLNASQISLSRSVSQSNSIDLIEAQKQQPVSQQAQATFKSSLHVGRRDQTKNNQTNFKNNNDSNKRSETRDQKNTKKTDTKTKMLPRAQSTIGTPNKINNKNLDNPLSNLKTNLYKQTTNISNVASVNLTNSNLRESNKKVSSTEQDKNKIESSNVHKLNRKRYDKKFLLSLKDKKESIAFPEELKDFEYALIELVKFESQIAPNNIKTYAAAAASAIRTSPTLSSTKPSLVSQPPLPIKRSTTRERVSVSEISNRPIRAQSIASTNKQNLNEKDKKTSLKPGVPVATPTNKRAQSQARSSSVAKFNTLRGVDTNRSNKSVLDKTESSLKNSKTYDIIPSIPLIEHMSSKDSREVKLEQKLLPIFNNENTENYNKTFLMLKDEFHIENEKKPDTDKVFVRALVAALCASCFDGKKLDIGSFMKRYFILKEFTNSDCSLELELLKSVQALDHKLKHIPENYLSEEIFYKWRDEPTQEGHNQSVYRLKEFFELLAELNKNIRKKTQSSTLTEETKSSIQKKSESIAASVSNTRKARIEKSRSKLNSILNSTKAEPLCSKCLQSITQLKQQNVQLMSSICGHIICKSCANKLFVSNTTECPICKKTLDKASIHDIYL